MPGLSQLKHFSDDLLALGNEVSARASRGEQPVKVEIPNTIEDKNDSEDFVLGMPEIEAEHEDTSVDEDLSDLAGLATPSKSDSKEQSDEPASSFEAPDMSTLLTPLATSDNSGASADIPDLSMFDEPEQQETEPVVEEPEEVSIADMSLDDLLAGGGFDQPEEEPEKHAKTEIPNINDFEEVKDFDEIGTPAFDKSTAEDAQLLGEFEPGEKIPYDDEKIADVAGLSGDVGFSDDKKDDENDSAPENLASLDDFDSFDLPDDFQSSGEKKEPSADDLSPVDDLSSIDDLPSAESFDTSAESSDISDDFDIPSEDYSMPADGNDIQSDDFDSLAESFGKSGDFDSLTESSGKSGDFDTSGDFDVSEESFDAPAADSLSHEESADKPASADSSFAAADSSFDDISLPDDFDLSRGEQSEHADVQENKDDFDSLDESLAAPSEEIASADAEHTYTKIEDTKQTEDDSGSVGLEPFDGFDSSDLPDDSKSSGTKKEPTIDDLLGGLDFDTPDSSQPFDDSDSTAAAVDATEDVGDIEIPDTDEKTESDDVEDSESADTESTEPLEIFDTSEMDGLDFGIQETDSQLGGGDSGFDSDNNDDFLNNGEFEIRGFSDVDIAHDKNKKVTKLLTSKDKDKGKGKRAKNIDEADFSDAEESEDLPPNTLTDAQYKEFLKNLSEYPLNLRLAFENLLVQDEFTDDAEFEVIEKILKKAPARQVASMLEKMMDTSIPIPRDFEHRTAAEYDAYKKSLSYQLRNKIIPGMLVGIMILLASWGLFNFGKYCIYRPIKANGLYKQGYALLQADEYPQSEMKFEEAVSYRINKKWFFNYARGYRQHKQYQRAGKMYKNILAYFKHDKTAGIEYADMELNDLANYERAEEIVKREVLDWHINDADGILKLGDVYLEWGTEKDPSKLELARAQYATLIQLYKPNDLYLSRMMRYFIRSDNLREVLQSQQRFEPREKSLNSDDWAELSGYLLDKYYGPLAPSEEYLRYEIEGLRGLLLRAVKTNPNNPVALYNLAKYFINSGETGAIEKTLQTAIEKFNTVPSMKRRDVYKYIDAYRLLGEHYITTTDYLQAQEQFAEGISLFTTERDNAGFEGTPAIGKLYKDMGDIKYSISGDYDDALLNYKYSVELENDSPAIRYRIGYIQYKNGNYLEALGSFMKAGDGNVKERNLLLAMANTLYLRGDDYAAEGYYNQLIDTLDREIAERGLVLPQINAKDYVVVNTYLYASNNYGVTLYKLAKRTGNSKLNGEAIVQFSQSVRAWDALTRNQETLVRLSGSNLAEQNIQYITHPIPEFEPAVYTEISKTLLDKEKL